MIGVIGLQPAPSSDNVAAWLDRHGLVRQLAVHLENQLPSVPASERPAYLLRMAELYAELLESEHQDESRKELERRGRSLLKKIGPNATSALLLRLALLRGAYRGAERLAELWRFRATQDQDEASIRLLFEQIITDLSKLNNEVSRELTAAERRLERASRRAASVEVDRVTQLRSLSREIQFLLGWSKYYVAWLGGPSQRLTEARSTFWSLLEPKQNYAAPEKVAKSDLEVEYLARAVLGLALITSNTGQLEPSLKWLALLEHEDVYEGVRNQVPTWWFIIQLEQGNYEIARDMLEQLQQAEGTDEFGAVADERSSRVTWLRMAAVAALAAEPQTEEGRKLARWAITELAAEGQMQSVLDLARRFGSDAMGSSGFAIEYVEGVIDYHDLREEHGDEQPTEDPELRERYAQVAEQLRAASQSPDRVNYPEALVDCERLLAWSEYFQGQWAVAALLFERVANQQRPPVSADAHWMAIVCLDLLRKQSSDQVDMEHLASLVDSFLQLYPLDERSGQLVLHQALNESDISPASVDRLMNISYDSDVYDQAQRRAAQMLYQLFRESSMPQKLEYAAQYLTVALPLITEDAQNLNAISKLELDRLIARCRRVLDVALSSNVQRMTAARQALGILDLPQITAHVDLSDVADELNYLRLKERLLSGDFDQARDLATRLHEADPEGLWSRQAARLLFREAVERRASTTDSRDIDSDVMKYGARILEEYADEPDALKRPTVRQYTIEIARSALNVWNRSQEPEAGRLARELYGQLLEAYPRDRSFLRASALLEQSQGNSEKALAAWRRLLNGLPMDSDGWYEAKYQQIKILAELDPDAARDVMSQFKVLHPDMGSKTWAERFIELDAQLRTATAAPLGGAL